MGNKIDKTGQNNREVLSLSVISRLKYITYCSSLSGLDGCSRKCKHFTVYTNPLPYPSQINSSFSTFTLLYKLKRLNPDLCSSCKYFRLYDLRVTECDGGHWTRPTVLKTVSVIYSDPHTAAGPSSLLAACNDSSLSPSGTDIFTPGLSLLNISQHHRYLSLSAILLRLL